jgi:hypothetical protein
LDFYSIFSLKQDWTVYWKRNNTGQCTEKGRHVTHFGHIILTLNQPVFAFGEETNTKVIVFGFEWTTFHSLDENVNYYTIKVVLI